MNALTLGLGIQDVMVGVKAFGGKGCVYKKLEMVKCMETTQSSFGQDDGTKGTFVISSFLVVVKLRCLKDFFYLSEHLRCGNGIHVEGYVV